MTSDMYLRLAAQRYAERGIAVCPLGLDDDDKPKRPLDDTYPRFRVEQNARHNWGHEDVKGLGIILGRPSGMLAVLDIDHIGMAGYLERWLSSLEKPPLMCRTPQGLHIYCQEQRVSKPQDLAVRYQGRNALVQILAGACVAAAPSTPGYEWLNPDAQPAYGNALEIWHQMSIRSDVPLYYRERKPWHFAEHALIRSDRWPTQGGLRCRRVTSGPGPCRRCG
jgi:hypothetical protein